MLAASEASVNATSRQPSTSRIVPRQSINTASITVPSSALLIHARTRQLVVDEDGALAIYRPDGAMTSLSDLDAGVRSIWPTVLARLPAGRVASAPPSFPRTLNTAWIDDIVVSAQSRSNEGSNVRGMVGTTTTRDANGLSHYVRTLGANNIDVALDPAAGALTAIMVVAPSGTRHTTHTYVAGPNGMSVRWRTRIEQVQGSTTRLTLVTLSNILIDGQAVQP